jgi:drug/metabolite transporter (DMT)-like permease
MGNFTKGILFCLTSACSYGLLPVFTAFAYRDDVTTSTLLFLRFAIAALFLLIWAFAKFRKFRVSKRDLLFFFILGAVFYNIQSRCFFESIKLIPASMTALILYTYPIIVMVLSAIFYKEKITVKIAGAIGITLIGLVMLLGTSFGGINSMGVLFALGSAGFYSIYIIISNYVLKSIQPLVACSFVTMFTSVGMLATGLVTSDISFSFNPSAWLWIICIVIFCTVVAMLFFFKGMELVGPTNAAIISIMEPISIAVFTSIFLHSNLTWLQLLGGGIILGGSVLAIWFKSKSSEGTVNDCESSSDRMST